MAPISRDDLEAAHRGMVTALENVLFDLGEVGRLRCETLIGTHQEIITELQDKLEEPASLSFDEWWDELPDGWPVTEPYKRCARAAWNRAAEL